MRGGASRSRLSRISRAVAFGIALVSTPADAQPAGEAVRRIDGSSPASFERSVASLQNELPSRERGDFEIALAVIWLKNTLGFGDADRDGDVDVDDMKLLENDSIDLLAEIRRGDLLSAVEKREKNAGGYTATAYRQQLDGLAYDEVVELAGRPTNEPYLDALRRLRAGFWCAPAAGFARAKVCGREFQSVGASNTLNPSTAKALNTAIKALNSQNYAAARDALEGLNLARLLPYERSKVEQILSQVSYQERSYAEAREHLLTAIDAGGLTPQEVSVARSQIGVLEALLARDRDSP
jgi:hypothetical protein